jgi:hypothetical protein
MLPKKAFCVKEKGHGPEDEDSSSGLLGLFFSKILNRISFEERPPEADSRSVPPSASLEERASGARGAFALLS